MSCTIKEFYLRGGKSKKPAEKWPEPFCGHDPLGGGRGETETEILGKAPSRAPAAQVPPLACLPAGPRSTDTGRRKAQEEMRFSYCIWVVG